ncbi:MAG: SDR family oxidoreductase [Chloroflexi bacterium]|nr:SDR family oxidoreductase [Chloroflexota bacterium]
MYLVTGGAGFIGSHIVETLVAQGEAVRVLDNFCTGRRGNLAGLLPRIELVEGDLADPGTVRRAMRGVAYVLHQGALPSVPRSVAEPLVSHASNATGTLNVLVAALEAGVRKVVYASSSSVYGDLPGLPKDEEMPTRPLSPYGVTKLMGEHYCAVFSQLHGLPTVSLRYFNVFGPRQDPASQYAAVIPRFIQAMLAGQRPTIYGDGGQSRDFTYVGDVVRANLAAARQPTTGALVLNAACGRRYSLLELVAYLNGILGTQIEPRFDPPRPGDIRHSQAAVERLAQTLGLRLDTPLEEGLRRTVAWLRGAAADG